MDSHVHRTTSLDAERKYDQVHHSAGIALHTVLLGITIIVFLLIHLAPGDPGDRYDRSYPGDINPEMIAREKAKLGLDKPVPVQYVYWLGRVVRGDLGYSLINPQASHRDDRIAYLVYVTVDYYGAHSERGGRHPARHSFGSEAVFVARLSCYALFILCNQCARLLSGPGPDLFAALKLQWLPTSGMPTLGQPDSLWIKSST